MTQVTDSLLLDQYPNTYAAYSLHRLRSDYTGPAIRVRRGSDNAEQDFGFGDDNKLDVSAVENWLSGADGYVTTWYSQIDGEPDLTQTDTSRQPRIAELGTVFTDSEGRIAIKFDRSRNTYINLDGSLSTTVPIDESLVYGVGESGITSEDDAKPGILNLAPPGAWSHEKLGLRGRKFSGQRWESPIFEGGHYVDNMSQPGFWAANHANSKHDVYSNNSNLASKDLVDTENLQGLTLGVQTKNRDEGFDGYLSEVAILPARPTKSGVKDVYDVVNTAWGLGPQNYNRGALMPQREGWHVTLYDWLETISVEDVTLPDGSLSYDNSYSSEDELADIWLKTRKMTASSVTRRIPEWYVLDDGNGRGIEGTGVVRANHNPEGNKGYGGNPPRSWQNEPAYLYQLDIPLSGGGQGNDFYQNAALGRRAMIVSSVDLIMHQGLDEEASYNWYDMKGKAFLGMAEAYRWAGDVLSSDAQDAYESGMEAVVDDLTARGPRAVNTNMDMFALHGAADLYMATDDATLQQKCVEMVKSALFGYKDGELETNHKVFKAKEGYDGGVFDPSGFIMEGDQPDVFYGGESILQLMGALQAVTDRQDGSVDSNWTFLEEVVRRLQEWRTDQMFYDPAEAGQYIGNEATTLVTAGTGFSGRTSADVPTGQGGRSWKFISIADRFSNDAFKAEGYIKPTWKMEDEISDALSYISGEMSSRYTAEDPDEWKGWSPWTKVTPYIPPEGWYSTLKTLKDNDDPTFREPPAARTGEFWNKALGGPPTGKEYWSYKQEDSNGESFGFFVEAQAHQGGYPGWYGGKIETFWTESTGVVLINRHGKTGCDRSGVDDYSGFEDSSCWFNLDEKAAHHVWGRDENDNGFTTLLLRGRELSRTSTFDTGGSPPTVTVNNVFNDPSLSETTSRSGEQTGTEIEGSFEVENKFEAQSNGLKVTHALTSDETDDVNELWASLPVYLRHNNPHKGGDDLQGELKDTKIDYWDGSQWVELPYDTDADGVPEIVTTGALRLTRDYEGLAGNDGPAHAYVSFSTDQDVRRSKHKYYDPYQTKTGVRTVHIDLHGDPGTTKTLPASKSVSYTIQTTDPTEEGTSSTQKIPLQRGWNLVSASVAPDHADMDSVFAGLSSDTLIVKTEDGQRYRPGKDIDEIGSWNTGEAYSVYLGSEATLTMQGTRVSTSTVALEEGWNWIPYFPASPLPIEEALSSVTDQLVIVKDEAGNAYLPTHEKNTLESMEPGEGYKIHVNKQITLTYPDGSN